MTKQFALLKFYEFYQNNSGGDFIFIPEKGIGYYVIIQAINIDHAMQIAQEKGIYFNGVDEGIDCECCGDRWHEPTELKTLDDCWGTSKTYIHYLDGKIVEITKG